MKAGKNWIIVICGGSLALVLLMCCLISTQMGGGPTEYRFPFPPENTLSEKIAIELSRQALILDGKHSTSMRPVPSGHTDASGRELYYCTRQDNANAGFVLWWLERPSLAWEYMVGVTRQGNEVVCIISKPH